MNTFLRLLPLPIAALLLCSCTGTTAPTAADAGSQGTLIASTRATSGSGTSPALELAGDPEGVLRRGGRLYYVKDRGLTEVTAPQNLGSGMTLERNGDVTLGDGRRFRTREGYIVTRGGDVVEAR